MACSLNSVFRVPDLNESMFGSRTKGALVPCPSKTGKVKSWGCSVLSNAFMGKSISLDEKGSGCCNSKSSSNIPVHAQATICVSKALKWWKKTLKPNMIEIHSAQELVHSLVNAGDSLLVVDFYSPGCGGCKALHPKICQIAELYPNATFLKVNYEELKTMCHGLRIHVLPFFRFYRGSEGRVCSFSCTNATIKKFKDALAKHGSERCSFGPTKGLEESELKILASIGEINSSPLLCPKLGKLEDLVMESHDFSGVWSMESNSRGIMLDAIY
ncbi:thioredoxin-like 1-2, chloroplastic [Glycine soja]|uniref:Thioredoxin-like 1-1, chloroplastic n=1 Tax=Glycine soja TaxID=3848 RepID=A0A0B2P2H5_GLYSO|nr:thioredoxin-like 1-2, chloroplastic [Glycine soja]KHN01877.1 Thioredoxin-like 1-1, chloroplastic [Glycine soja]RZC16898.1 Thioredoxin-like 1-1, chloroplastic [Glycine soja]